MCLFFGGKWVVFHGPWENGNPHGLHLVFLDPVFGLPWRSGLAQVRERAVSSLGVQPKLNQTDWSTMVIIWYYYMVVDCYILYIYLT